VSLEASVAAWSTDLPPAEKLLLLSLADHADERGCCWPSFDRLSDRTGLHRVTVIRLLRLLEGAKHISVERAAGRANRYLLHPVQGSVTSSVALPVARGYPLHDPTGSTALPVAQCDGGSSTTLPDQLHGATRIFQESLTNRPEHAHACEEHAAAPETPDPAARSVASLRGLDELMAKWAGPRRARRSRAPKTAKSDSLTDALRAGKPTNRGNRASIRSAPSLRKSAQHGEND